VAVVVLVRHGRSTANTAGILAGRRAGVALDDVGVAQATALGERLSGVPVARVATSPLERCRQTIELVLPNADPVVDQRLIEMDYGDWTDRSLRSLTKEPLWRSVQQHPSGVVFPAGEAFTAMSARATQAVREHDALAEEAAGPDAVTVCVSHGDVLKAVLADALGLHLDLFQRLVLDPCSVSIVRYTPVRPMVLRVNDTAGDLSWLRPRRRRRRRPSGEATVGGGTGAEEH
jgi:probable phosphomutase (TIGR03848 family)